MIRRAGRVLGIVVVLVAVFFAGVLVSGCSVYARRVTPAGRPAAPVPTVVVAQSAPAPRVPSAAVTVWCGPDPRDPRWRAQMAALVELGATATHGPCRTPPADYLVLEPGARYAPPAEQLTLAAGARDAGLGFIPYDARLWSTDMAEQATAVAQWRPFVTDGTLVAVDLGDEPNTVDLPTMAARARVVEAELGVPTFTVFVGDGIAGQDLIESWRHLPVACPATDRYDDLTAALADALALQARAGCGHIAIDTTGRDLDGDGDGLSLELIRTARAAGLRVLLFTGLAPENFPTWTALVDATGTITPAGRAVAAALRSVP